MSCWLVTQDTRFAAAVPVAPVSNHVTQQLVSNIPEFVSLFLEDAYDNPVANTSRAARSCTPRASRRRHSMSAGALDRCTPAVEAVQFHNALLQHGVKSVLLTYPEEGHGIRKLPCCARLHGARDSLVRGTHGRRAQTELLATWPASAGHSRPVRIRCCTVQRYSFLNLAWQASAG